MGGDGYFLEQCILECNCTGTALHYITCLPDFSQISTDVKHVVPSWPSFFISSATFLCHVFYSGLSLDGSGVHCKVYIFEHNHTLDKSFLAGGGECSTY